MTDSATGPEPLTVHKIASYIELPVDIDGVPLLYGDRFIEAGPGQWAHPVGAAIANLLAEGLSLPTDAGGITGPTGE